MIKKIFKYIGVGLCSLALVFGSFFVTKNNTKNYLSASADSVSFNSVFTGSNLNFVITGFTNGSSSNFNNLSLDTYLFMSYRFRLTLDSGFITPSFNAVYNSMYYLTNGSDSGVDSFYNLGSPLLANAPYSYHYWTYVKGKSTKSLLGFSFYQENGDYSVEPTLNIISVIFSNYTDTHGLDANPNFCNSAVASGYYNFISYLDSSGYRYNFFIPSCYQSYYSYSESPYYYYNFRQYYYNFEISESQQYNAGYQEGLLDNQLNIYQKGYDAGYGNGVQNGIQQGIASANDYSFTSLMGSVIDAPVKAVTSLLNFNILGVNLLDFALGLFSIALIVTIIRLTKGG